MIIVALHLLEKLLWDIHCYQKLDILPTISIAKLGTFSTHIKTSAGANVIKFQNLKWS